MKQHNIKYETGDKNLPYYRYGNFNEFRFSGEELPGNQKESCDINKAKQMFHIKIFKYFDWGNDEKCS